MLGRIGRTFCGRTFCTAAYRPSLFQRHRDKLLLATGGLGGVLVQTYFGSAEDIFEQKYVTKKSPEDLAEFYQAEELVKMFFAMFGPLGPKLFEVAFSGIMFSDEPVEGWESTAVKPILGGKFMEASFTISEEETETEDGETVLGYLSRHERFKHYVPYTNLLLWDTQWNYGFVRRSDGTCEVFHRGEKFYGPFLARLVIYIHQSMVTYMCEKFVNSEAFGSGDSELVEEMQSHIPQHIFKGFVRSLRGDVERAKAQEEARAKLAATPYEVTMASLRKYEATIEKLKELEKQRKPPSAKITMQRTLKRQPSLVMPGEVAETTRNQTTLNIPCKEAEKTIQQAMRHIGATGTKAAALAELVNSEELVYKDTTPKK